ncbi:MAG: hypothetical protein LC708_03355, partial [Actinobacteria bacterium]|nr:hypothetical protein [Actinomycetota bacterium]
LSGPALMLAGVGQRSADADVSAVQGRAYGYSGSITLFGAAQPPVAPTPTVTLPPAGSSVPVTATAPTGSARFGPAQIFSSGPITVSTQGTTGPTGSVTSSASLGPVNTSGQEVFTASSVASECTASEAGVSGSTTVVGGVLQTSEGDPAVDGDETLVNVPANPAPNTAITGTIETVGDTFRYVFNEQIVNPDGSITVRAFHQYLLGPTAVGDFIAGEVVCGVTATAPPTSVTPTSVTPTSVTPTSVTPTSVTPTSVTPTTTAPTTTTTAAEPTTTTTTDPTTTATTVTTPSGGGNGTGPREVGQPLARTGTGLRDLNRVAFALLAFGVWALVVAPRSGRAPKR